MVIQISPAEREMLVELVNWRIDQLGPETHHTDRPEYRAKLEEQRDMLRRFRERLAQAEVTA